MVQLVQHEKNQATSVHKKLPSTNGAWENRSDFSKASPSIRTKETTWTISSTSQLFGPTCTLKMRLLEKMDTVGLLFFKQVTSNE